MFDSCVKSGSEPRTPASLLLSAGIHCAILLAVCWLPAQVVRGPAHAKMTAIFLAPAVEPPRRPFPPVRRSVAPPAVTRLPVARPAYSKAVPELPPPPVVAGTATRPDPTLESPAILRPPTAPPHIAAFEGAAIAAPSTPVHATEIPARAIPASGFEAPRTAAIAIPAPQRLAEAGFGEVPLEGNRRQGAATLASAGFGQSTSPQTMRRTESTAPAGFGSASPAQGTVPAKALAAAAPFDTARTAAPPGVSALERRPTGGFTPVEILSKPRPAYTDEGRRARVEGEVTLEVLFSASGKARVLRTLNRLGHGLDESALRAAEEIRFHPATREGRPEDTVATVRIDFRLAY